MTRITYNTTDRPSPAEYIDFLKNSDLGQMYPKKAFRRRIKRLLQNAGVSVTARDDRRLVGICLGVTDHTYFLFITDLGVVRGYARQGIGRALLRRAHRAAGGPDDVVIVTWSNAAALPFYAACGLAPQHGLVGREAPEHHLFDVRDLTTRCRRRPVAAPER